MNALSNPTQPKGEIIAGEKPEHMRDNIARFATKARLYDIGQYVFGRLGGGFILAFHDLASSQFQRQIQGLYPNQPVHLSELFHRSKNGQSTAGLFAMTVDDGVGQTVRNISTVCVDRGWPVTFFLPTGYLDGTKPLPFQTWQKLAPKLPQEILTLRSTTVDLSTDRSRARFDQTMRDAFDTQARDGYERLIAELVDWAVAHGAATREQLEPAAPISWSEVEALSKHDVVHFESHGVSHTAVAALSPEQLREELTTSRLQISEHTNRECRHFCYPFGGKRAIGALAPSIVAAIYDTAVTMSRGRLSHHSWSLMPRIPIYEMDSPDIARLKILTV